uniref:NAD(P)H-quinone oxidoreductase subunit 6, chloroplastic n=1 Tax=Nephroselmis pyriformis TaxID=156128 RepID=A0A8A2H8P2_9CHLO|nr:subunit 6 of NADH-plastoquinoneoxidoreductase [Nephroselmis pyriformis]QSV37319.1 subunit 6 of NADH-plastoquinoneoxidoreductase [Nephroselmis pyriformis]
MAKTFIVRNPVMTLSETTQTLITTILDFLILGGALGVILLPSIVYAAFLLGAVLSSVAFLYVLLNADFLAAAQLLIYVGAINILILFAIMLVNPQKDFQATRPSEWSQYGAAGISVLLGTAVSQVIFQTPWVTPSLRIEANPLPILGGHLFSDFLLPFELISVLLLVALIGAIVLARRETSMGDTQ